MQKYVLHTVRTIPQTALLSLWTSQANAVNVSMYITGQLRYFLYKHCYMLPSVQTLLAIIGTDYMLPSVHTLPQTPLYYTGYQRYRLYVTVCADTTTNSVIQYWLSVVQTICYRLCGHYHKLRYTILAIIGTDYMLPSVRTLPQTPLYYTGYHRYRLYVTICAYTTTNSVILYWLSAVQTICYRLCGHYHKLRYTIFCVLPVAVTGSPNLLCRILRYFIDFAFCCCAI